MTVTSLEFLTPADIKSFWAKVDQSGGPASCWPWQAGRMIGGYGVFCRQRKGQPRLAVRAHRLAYILTNGPLPEDRPMVRHMCDNRPCCNPAHLIPGTAKENALDVVERGRHWTKARPEDIVRGDAHWSRRNPEQVPRGEGHGGSKLSADQVRAIRRQYEKEPISQRVLAAKFGVSQPLIWKIVTRQIWADL